MATNDEILALADQLRTNARISLGLRARILEAVANNTAQGIDWASLHSTNTTLVPGGTADSELLERDYSPNDVLNMISALAALDGIAGFHWTNLHVVSPSRNQFQVSFTQDQNV